VVFAPTLTNRRAARPAALATVLAVLFLTFLDTTIVSVTLGDVQADLGAGVISLQWVINGYALVFASLMLTAGSLGDRFGRKWVMVGGVVIFCAGSLVCALAGGVGVLIAGRAVMGVGAAASEPGTLSVIRQLYPDSALRSRALGAWSAVSGLALALGPVIGGLLVGAWGWRSVFWFNLALSLVLLVAVVAVVPNSRDPQPGRLDLAGFVLGAAVLGCAVFGVISGEDNGYGTWWVLALFGISALALAVFVPVEQRVRSPMLRLAYVRQPIVAAALFVAFAVYFGVFAIFFFTALYLDAVVGYSGWRLAGVFSPMAAGIVIGAIGAGRWIASIGTRIPMITGCLLGALGMVLSRAQLDAHPGFWPQALAMGVAGLGFGVAVVPLTSAVLGNVPAAHSGMAASATNTARQLGAVVGVAALGALVNAHLTGDLVHRLSRLGYGKDLQSVVIGAIEGGGGSSGGLNLQNPPAVLRPIVSAAVDAFLSGLRASLLVSAIVVVVAAVIVALVSEPGDLTRGEAPAGSGGDDLPATDAQPAQPTSTTATSAGSAPPSTASNGSA
jgi:EmrB/QacA subfamily drug resistance transporter